MKKTYLGGGTLKKTVPKPTRENVEKLAKRVVEDMDIDALVEFAEEKITDWYLRCCDYKTWKEDWLLNMRGETYDL